MGGAASVVVGATTGCGGVAGAAMPSRQSDTTRTSEPYLSRAMAHAASRSGASTTRRMRVRSPGASPPVITIQLGIPIDDRRPTKVIA